MEYFHLKEEGIEEHLFPYAGGALLLRYSPKRTVRDKIISPAVLLVTGIVKSYKERMHYTAPVSDVSPILDKQQRMELTDILKKKWEDADIVFWPLIK